MTPDPRAFVIVEQVAHGQWHCLTPDDTPAPVVNYASALSAGLLAASASGWGLACTNLEGTTVLVAFPERVRRRALVIRQLDRTEWYVVVRDYCAPPPGHPPFVVPKDSPRSYADALAHAHVNFRATGLPVLIEPQGEEARFLSPSEQRAFRNSYTPSYPTYPTLGDILDGGPRHER